MGKLAATTTYGIVAGIHLAIQAQQVRACEWCSLAMHIQTKCDCREGLTFQEIVARCLLPCRGEHKHVQCWPKEETA